MASGGLGLGRQLQRPKRVQAALHFRNASLPAKESGKLDTMQVLFTIVNAGDGDINYKRSSPKQAKYEKVQECRVALGWQKGDAREEEHHEHESAEVSLSHNWENT